MKNPRQLLLERHQADEERLNAISESVVEKLSRNQGRIGQSESQIRGDQAVPAPSFSWAKAAWHWYWRGLAAVWLSIIALHLGSLGLSFSTRDQPVAQARELTPEMLELLQQQWALRQELISPVEFARDNKPHQSPPRGPRSALPIRSGIHKIQA